jgi:hypothetical protein
MKRILVLPGAFGSAWCDRAATLLAQRLDLPCIDTSEAVPEPAKEPGWIATAAAGTFSGALLRAADTAVWLHYSPLGVAKAWARGLRVRLCGKNHAGHLPRLADVNDSLLHMAWTPHLHRLLRHPALAHLQIFHLRSPDETDFWLRAQEHRLPARLMAVAHSA